MKLYSKIIGIILTLLGIGALIWIVFGIFEQNSVEDKVLVSLLFIPCSLYLNFMYIHNFGFNLRTEIPNKNYRFILVLSVLSLVISTIVPAGYLLNQINLESKANVTINRGQDATSNLKLKATLKTKFESGQIMYVINISNVNDKELDLNNYESFSIGLYDKDEFLIKTINIKYDDLNFKIINDKIYTLTSNSSKDITLKNYLKISKWELLYKTN